MSITTYQPVVLCFETKQDLPRLLRCRMATPLGNGVIVLTEEVPNRVRWRGRVFELVEFWLDTGFLEYHERTDVAVDDAMPEVLDVEVKT